MLSRNGGHYLEDSINSIKTQTYQNWELFLLDNNSSDDSIQIALRLKGNDKRIHIYQSPWQRTIPESRNFAVAETHGRYIAFLDSIDIWEPTKLEKQLAFMQKNCYSFSYTSFINSKKQIKHGPRIVTYQQLQSYCWINYATAMYDKKKLGLIQVNPINRFNDAYGLLLGICRKANCYLLDESLVICKKRRFSCCVSQIMQQYKLLHNAEGVSPAIAVRKIMCGMLFRIGLIKT